MGCGFSKIKSVYAAINDCCRLDTASLEVQFKLVYEVIKTNFYKKTAAVLIMIVPVVTGAKIFFVPHALMISQTKGLRFCCLFVERMRSKIED